MRPLQTSKIILLALTLPALFGCDGNKLSRSEAKNLIVKAYSLPRNESVELKKTYYISQQSHGWSTALISGERYSDHKRKLEELQSKGVITIGDTTFYGTDIDITSAIVKLTNEGKKYLIQDDGDKFIVKSCEVDFGEITGIQIQEQFKVAEANYTLIRKNITPFGENISQRPENRRSTFSLYDDGWRINR